jgi:hypothetical protein
MKHKLPTKEQKFKIYTLALELYRSSMGSGMCYYISRAQKQLSMFVPNSLTNIKFSMKAIEEDKFNNLELNFPEIFKYKPKLKFVYQYWWNCYTEYGQRKRIKILKEAIEACKPINQ